ncbi:BrnA antitoxin family protein [Oricola cellulosilytica]|uniref:BrnA antitoxin family protein n=1 Tax=Oricola cellulosilytica TaxID=1429082 RepID=A0A4R0PCU2_9HYPH|nr:BrnA antitoxin family protein [Oricola cellulosilytica]TCD15300.1 hypothetical protein E0D97_07125 [Oricola cellulosilytica]
MAHPPRRHVSPIDKAEALFKAATTKRAETGDKPRENPIPRAKETVSLRIDGDVLAHFQEDGPGWQDRINAALRDAAGLD